MLQIKPILSMLLRSKSSPLLLLLQIILSVAIVANASFIIHERLALMDRDSGVVEQEVFDFTMYSFDPSVDLVQQQHKDLQLIRDLPGVKSATFSSMTPLSGGGWSSSFTIGTSEEDERSAPNSAMYYGDEQMVDTLGVKLIEGRNLRPEEILPTFTDSGVKGIVSKAFADQAFPDESAVGKVIYNGNLGEEAIEIIGVVERLQGAWVNSDNLEYSVIIGVELTNAFMRYLVRAEEGTFTRLKEQIPEVLHKDQKNRVIQNFTTLTEHRTSVYRDHELMASVLSLMVVLLLLITSLGLTGMVMFNIERRTKQIGTRRALGATKRDVVSLFLVENYIICLVGGVVGGLLAIALGQQLMQHYDLPQLEWQYPLATIVGLVIVTTLAVIFPATKAAKISPAIATRSV
ncbi:FtsX-like permease family protein [Shewanella sp. Scap07]|uniref:ABC transporter permease n=1 Tax=Shewanella sp. Scap07 TaxID=2589987 RepID=UPI0015C0365F|nr:FtsX-like permease family protein [Shewanella sp. Scap07]QLE86712.1 FtsX-like permease family protein [Shewanella sp. Scap07]